MTGRVTDAALVVGPALHAFGWSDDDLDAIAGAVVAGHVIECGAQCCGGNYAFFEEIPDRERIGFPIAEVHPDGTSVITKHPGTGGAVTVGTVTAQLLYEIGGPRYLSPDAVARFDSIELAQEGRDRVRISGVRGEPPPPTLKVTANLDAGWRNAMTLALTGAQPAEKARFAADAVWAGIPGGRAAFAETAEELSGDLSGAGLAYLRLAVRGDDERTVGRAFSGAVVETSLSSYPGTFFTSAPPGAQGVARYWPTTVAASAVTPRVECDGHEVPVDPTADPRPAAPAAPAAPGPVVEPTPAAPPPGPAGRPAGWRPATSRCRSGSWSAPARATRAATPTWACGPTATRPRPGCRVLLDRGVPGGPARGGALRGGPSPAAEPARGELRRPRYPRLGRGVEPPARHAGQGTRRIAPIAVGGGAALIGLERAGRGALRRLAGRRLSEPAPASVEAARSGSRV